MLHIDVKKLGRIAAGAGWRADPSAWPAEVLPDEKGPTCAGFLTRAAAAMAAEGAPVRRGS